MLLHGSISSVVVKLSVLFVLCTILYQVALDRLSEMLNAPISESLQKWRQGPDVYMRSIGYEFEWQQFRTADGVNIRMHHFWKGRNNETGIPVLFQPTTLTNGDIWLTCDPSDCFPHLLANCGYDIWVVNYRGNKYSPYGSENRSFTIDDHIREDLPGAIDYVLEKTRRKNLHLISYSKGTTVSFGLLASRPEYNQKIRMHIAMAPVTFIRDPVIGLRVFMALFGFLSQENTIFPGSGRVFVKSFGSNRFVDPLHRNSVPIALQMLMKSLPFMKNLFFNFAITSRISFEPTFFDDDYLAMGLYSSTCDGLSHHELYHAAQKMCAKRFQSFNYSQVPEEYRQNFSVIPYDITRITVPTLILEVSRDIFNRPEDHQSIRAQHRNLLGAYRVKLPNYMHSDGLTGRNKSSIYGRAFASEMLKFDGDEMNSTCHFDPVEDFKNLEKMEVDSLAETPEINLVTKLVSWPLEILTKNYCQYFI